MRKTHSYSHNQLSSPTTSDHNRLRNQHRAQHPEANPCRIWQNQAKTVRKEKILPLEESISHIQQDRVVSNDIFRSLKNAHERLKFLLSDEDKQNASDNHFRNLDIPQLQSWSGKAYKAYFEYRAWRVAAANCLIYTATQHTPETRARTRTRLRLPW